MRFSSLVEKAVIIQHQVVVVALVEIIATPKLLRLEIPSTKPTTVVVEEVGVGVVGVLALTIIIISSFIIIITVHPT